MSRSRSELALFLRHVRARWGRVRLLRAWAQAMGAAAATGFLAIAMQRLVAPSALSSAWLWSIAIALALVCVASVARVMRRQPTDLQIAHLVEEQCPDLEDALVTAVSVPADAPAPLAGVVLADALRRVRVLPLDRIVSSRVLGRASLAAVVATLVMVTAWAVSIEPAVRGVRLMAFYAMPGRFGLVVTPGDARIPAGQGFDVHARLPAVAEGAVPVVAIDDGERRREIAMQPRDGGFVLPMASVERDFRYSVSAAGVRSAEYTVTAIHRARVRQIDLHYEYPAAFRMEPRDEKDGGDIYAPAGTRVRVSIQADKPLTRGALNLPDGTEVALVAHADRLEGELTVTGDNSYRIAMSDLDGLTSSSEVEYFIRTLNDRPPDVRIVQPAADRRASPVEEVGIEARADDDFGVAGFDLVFSVRGQRERVVPFARSEGGLSVSGKQVIYLENLGLKPGDFVTYYARATDVSRGKRSTESRSDMFFIEIGALDEQFVETDGQGGAGGGDQAVTDLIDAQKEVITFTWTLDRRIRDSGGRPESDIRALAKAQADVRRQALSATAQALRAADVRRRRNGVRPPAGPVPLAESDDALGRAADAMLKAETELQALRTAPAIPFEMTALNELMRADSDIRRREIQRQQTAGNGRGNGRQEQDLSSLFDKELARQQQTNYETPRATSETRKTNPQPSSDIDKVRELARRQGALNEQHSAGSGAAAGRPDQDESRQLDRLTRAQLDLKREADDLARELGQQESRTSDKPQSAGSSGSRGEERGRRKVLEQVAEDMQAAADGLRQQNRDSASERGEQALERLQDLERELQAAAAGESEATKRLNENLARLRELEEDLANAERQVSEASEAGSRLDGRDRQGSPQDSTEAGSDPWQGAKQLVDELRRERELGISPESGRFSPGRSSPGTEAWKQDLAQWDSLRVQLRAALEKAEASTVARLRGQRARDRLNAGASQTVPESYRQLVERYYRALAGDTRP